MMATTLPDLPAIRLELLGEEPEGARRFLVVERRRHRAHYPDGSSSDPFVYDEIAREALDAAVVAAHFVRDGERWVHLRSAVRPPVSSRAPRSAAEERARHGGLWELPAGLVEPDEVGVDGPRRCAQREVAEELGYVLPIDALRPLGPSTFPAPGIIGERHYFFEVEVDAARRGQPSLDGSPLERGGAVIAVPLLDALAACRAGFIEDAKSELGLRRLAERHR